MKWNSKQMLLIVIKGINSGQIHVDNFEISRESYQIHNSTLLQIPSEDRTGFTHGLSHGK